ATSRSKRRNAIWVASSASARSRQRSHRQRTEKLNREYRVRIADNPVWAHPGVKRRSSRCLSKAYSGGRVTATRLEPAMLKLPLGAVVPIFSVKKVPLLA